MGFRIRVAFVFLWTWLFVGTCVLMTSEPWRAIRDLPIPNAASPLQLLPSNFTYIDEIRTNYTSDNKIPMNWTLDMPEPLWPAATRAWSKEERSERLTYWLSLMAGSFFVTVAIGTGIVAGPNLCTHGGSQELHRDVGGCLMPTSCMLATISYLLLTTKVVVSSAWSGTLSPGTGLDFEGAASLGLWLLAWMLGQAVALRIMRSQAKFGTFGFLIAALTTTLPFLADPFDTAKDAMFAGIALQSTKVSSQAIGWVSLVWLWGMHGYMLLDAGLRNELQGAYLSILTIAPENTSVSQPDDSDSSESQSVESGTSDSQSAESQLLLEEGDAQAVESQCCSCYLFILKKVFAQVTPDRRKAILVEDAPQGLMAIIFMVLEQTVNILILISNIIIPAGRWLFAYLAYPWMMQKDEILEWLTIDMLNAAKAGLTSKVSVLGEHLLTVDTKRLAKILSQESLKLSLPVEAGVVAMFVQDKFGEVIQGDGTELKLSWCGLGEAAGVALAEALKANSALTQLHLYNNNLGEAAGVALAEALKANSALTVLSLYNNNLGEAAGVALLDALKTNTTLETINLFNNPALSEATKQAIQQRLNANKEAKRTATSAGEAS